jgi:hypothetical protein
MSLRVRVSFPRMCDSGLAGTLCELRGPDRTSNALLPSPYIPGTSLFTLFVVILLSYPCRSEPSLLTPSIIDTTLTCNSIYLSLQCRAALVAYFRFTWLSFSWNTGPSHRRWLYTPIINVSYAPRRISILGPLSLLFFP